MFKNQKTQFNQEVALRSLVKPLYLFAILGLFFLQACQENSPVEEEPISFAETTTKHSQRNSKSIDYGDLHNCGLDFVRNEGFFNGETSPSYSEMIPHTVDYMVSECAMPNLSEEHLGSFIEMLEESPLNTAYPEEFLSEFIGYAIERAPEREELFSKYGELWAMVGSGESHASIEEFYENEILNGDWEGIDAMAVSAAEQIRRGSSNYWIGAGVSTMAMDGETVADMIGGGVCTGLAASSGFGLFFSPIAGAIGGLVVSAAVGGLIDNWGKW